MLVDLLRIHYGRPPIIYATEKSYRLYVAEEFADCDIWIRSVWRAPRLSDGRTWTFWQYTDRARLSGYTGEEQFIDSNVFAGSEEDFSRYMQ